jgi:hypothetical protein
MSYYVLPKNFNAIPINLLLTDEKIQLYASHSTYNYYNSSLKQLICDCVAVNSEITFETISKIINVYENISTVSKCKENSPLFYELLEIINVLYLFDGFHSLNMNLFILSSDNKPIVNCISFFRKGHNDTFISTSPYDFIFYELNYKDYVIEFILCLIKILKCQKIGGISIIKIHNLFYKPIIDIVYLLTFLFEKVFIIKPTISNVSSYEKFIICKGFVPSSYSNACYQDLSLFIDNYNKTQTIHYLIDFKIPCYFLNKINDINIILGQHQLETIQQFINILKNKNKLEKLDLLKNNNRQKCIQWCEKYKI